MKVDENALEIAKSNQAVLTALIDHFQYSIADIDSYEDLTEREKEILPKDVFDVLVDNLVESNTPISAKDKLRNLIRKYTWKPLKFTVEDLVHLINLRKDIDSKDIPYISKMMSCFDAGMGMIAINPNSKIDKIITDRYSKLKSEIILRDNAGVKHLFRKYDINGVSMYDCVESKEEDLLLIVHPSSIERLRYLISDVDYSDTK